MHIFIINVDGDDYVMTELEDYLKEFNSQPSLPLMHVTKAGTFVKYISKTKKLEPRDCPVFDERLLYFFYGRPAYKIDNENQIITNEYLFPVCFIFEPSNVDISQIYPFDTGAFVNGLYDEHINPLNKKEIDKDTRLKQCSEYSLGNEFELSGKFVSAFFNTNEDYITGELKKNLKFNYFHMTLNNLYSLLCETGKPLADDRKYTIEIQSKNEIEIPSNVIAVVLPSKAFDKPEVKNLLANWGILGLAYYSVTSPQTGTINGALFSEVARFLKKGGYI